ncbi:imelysin family protein [Flavobacteriaceae bacterium M23B6Z8]
MKKYISLILSSLTLVVLVACSSDSNDDGPTEPSNFDRGVMLENWADNIIVPAYQNFSNEVTSLKAAVSDFKDAPSENSLNVLRAQFTATYTAWQTVSMFEIGPAEQINLRLSVNTYPTDAAEIESNISSGTYDLALISNRNAKGFPALDYLLYGSGNTTTEIISKFSSDTNSANYNNYLSDVVNDIETLTAQVVNNWTSSYRDTFVSNDGSSASASVDRFVNDYIFYFEKFLRAGKMGIPLGVFSTDKLPSHVESFYNKELSNDLFLEGLKATQDFFNGKAFEDSQQGASLRSYLDALQAQRNNTNLSNVINNQFSAARSAVEGLSGNFHEEITGAEVPTQMLLAYDEVQKIVPLLKVDMVSAMSINIDFQDADGD